MAAWPVHIDEVRAARVRIEPYLSPTPLRHYAPLDAALGGKLRVLVKHENHQPTNNFKVRNALAVLTTLTPEERAAGVVTGTRGNHGQAVAWAAARLGIRATLCVPRGNNEEKNEAMRSLGAEFIEHGEDYDDAVALARKLAQERGMRLVHSTDDPQVIAGAATATLEILEQAPEIEALVFSVGGGSQAVGAMTVARAIKPGLEVYGVQAAAAPTIHDSWHARKPTRRDNVEATIAEGLATRDVYETTFDSLCEGLADFITVDEAEIADAIRLLLRATHNLAEGAGAAGLAGLRRLAARLAGRTVGVAISGGNIDQATLRRVIVGEL